MRNLVARLLATPPRESWSAAWALARGTLCIAYFRLARRNVRIGFPFKVHGPVVIEGPGSVTIEPGCRVNYNTFRGLSIVTWSRDAKVRLGERANVGGLAVRCRAGVTVGPRLMAATSLLQDYPADDAPGGVARPIEIGTNVWLGAQSIVLGGARIGDDSVVCAGSVVHGQESPAYSLLAGNPVRRPLPIGHLLQLRSGAR